MGGPPSQPAHLVPPVAGRFLTTRWSMILAARDCESPAHGPALASLCETYWYPVYCYVRRQGRSAADAEELTQEFFAQLLQKQWLRRADPEKGRFRSFVLVCVKRFLINEHERSHARKRGGGLGLISIDSADLERRFATEPQDAQTADRLFDRGWALAVLDRAMELLRQEMTAAGRQPLMHHLEPYLAGDAQCPSYAEVAGRLGISEGAAKVAAHRLRRRFADLVRAQVCDTIDNPDNADEEIRQLFLALSS